MVKMYTTLNQQKRSMPICFTMIKGEDVFLTYTYILRYVQVYLVLKGDINFLASVDKNCVLSIMTSLPSSLHSLYEVHSEKDSWYQLTSSFMVTLGGLKVS